jgi:hypothetical protein
LKGILQEVQAEFNIDPARLYVTGISMGCYGTWDLIMRNPGVFAAASPQSCRGDPNTTLLAKLKGMPIWSMCGTNDSYFAGAQAMADGMKQVGATAFTFTAMEGVGHSINDRGYDYPGFIDWMFAQRLTGAPSGGAGGGGSGGGGGAGGATSGTGGNAGKGGTSLQGGNAGSAAAAGVGNAGAPVIGGGGSAGTSGLGGNITGAGAPNIGGGGAGASGLGGNVTGPGAGGGSSDSAGSGTGGVSGGGMLPSGGTVSQAGATLGGTSTTPSASGASPSAGSPALPPGLSEPSGCAMANGPKAPKPLSDLFALMLGAAVWRRFRAKREFRT